jgi:4-hydroxy-2-oxoheptanedioate aldolase
MGDTAVIPDRLNGLIRVLESGGSAFFQISPAGADKGFAASTGPYDGVMFEMEHNPFNGAELRVTLQSMLNRRQIAESGSVAPKVTPIVRISPNGREMNQWVAKQVLDSGAYGIVWPHVSTVEEARNAVAACRYARPEGSEHYEPAGLRGDAPGFAARFWGLSQQEYYERADVWPLAPHGEIMVVIQCESVTGIRNLPAILDQVPVSAVMIGEGDLSQNLGRPREYEHPTVRSAMQEILDVCHAHGVVCIHPHTTTKNVERLVEEGYRMFAAAPVATYEALEMGRRAVAK